MYISIYTSNTYMYICVLSIWRQKGSTVGMQTWNAPKAPRKAKVIRLLESTNLAWVLSARSAETFLISP